MQCEQGYREVAFHAQVGLINAVSAVIHLSFVVIKGRAHARRWPRCRKALRCSSYYSTPPPRLVFVVSPGARSMWALSS